MTKRLSGKRPWLQRLDRELVEQPALAMAAEGAMFLQPI